MSTAYLDVVTASLLTPASLQLQDAEAALAKTMRPGVDYADLYFQRNRSENWLLEDGIIKDGGFHLEQGVGVRAISGEKTGFAYSDNLEKSALLQAGDAASSVVKSGQQKKISLASMVRATPYYAATDPISTLSADAKLDLLRRADTAAREADPRVKRVTVSLAGEEDLVFILASDGTLAADVRPLIRLNVSVIVESDGRRERGSAGGGRRLDYQYFVADDLPESFAKEAVRQALVNLEAVDAPAGSMPVVLASGWPGVLLHEAVGHGLEGDFNRRGSSAFSGRIGEQVASSLCTVVDDGTLSDRRGSLTVDDEGTPTQCTTLIENGRLTGYMQDKLNARLMGMPTTGNGRRESYAHLPMPRMTNTYMLAGPHKPDEIISSVKKGIYAVNFGGGQVDITSGKFVFSSSEAYLIENGKVTRPVKGATLIGNGPDVMNCISMVADDVALDSGIGNCGKDGQSVPVGVGQPTLKVDKLTVGGTA
ncbi:TldD protein, part of proposed TldE/TldD proteolytic complex [Methylophaga frappieri]|uniref:TldD protein, part of proposed TldE/TldD proteolytic complex n=1 Tax=Methylophaga frappieri (strain ATCC BAA-2434 / DSM 25690 / JAM7) TaxID=754477 RepID=I1YFR7_METFJ|nr:metalloprotease TldD [Methylophaga frappieri]AFJ01760.1 TldD protein, part of proposed TldE/TldD proteolytic complex [Methylophaga frappieri]